MSLTWQINSPDNKNLASASSDSTIKLWNKEGKLIRTLKGHEGRVTSLSFSLQGNIIASANDKGLIKLWSLDGKLLNSFEGGRSVAFSSDQENNLLAGADQDGIIRVWKIGNYDNILDKSSSDIKQGVNKDLISIFKGHTGSVTDVDFSQSNQRLMIVSGSDDNSIRFWSNPLQLIQSDKRFNDVSFGKSNDEIFDISSNRDISEYYISFWKVNQGFVKTVKAKPEELLNIMQKLNIVFFNGIDNILFIRERQLPLLHNQISFGDESFNSIVLSPYQNFIASGRSDYTVKIWSKNRDLIGTLEEHTATVHDVRWSADSQSIASASADGSIKLWKKEGNLFYLLYSMKGHSNTVKSVAFHPSENILASASVDKTIKLWRTDSQFLKTLEGHTAGVNDINFSRDGDVLISAGDDSTVIFWSFDLNTLQERGL